VPDVTVTWSSDNTSIATVSSTGTVKAVAAGGPVHITASVGQISGAAAVVDTLASVLTQVVVYPALDSLPVGDSQQILATGLDEKGHVMPNVSFTWSSDNSSVATVSATGTITAVVAGGPVHITAAAGQLSANSAVVVRYAVRICPWEIWMLPGKSVQFFADLFNGNGPPPPPATFTWRAWVPEGLPAAQVSATGLVWAERKGTAYIQATATGVGTSRKSLVIVSRTPPCPPLGPCPPTSANCQAFAADTRVNIPTTPDASAVTPTRSRGGAAHRTRTARG
jgi:hypothetical protein